MTKFFTLTFIIATINLFHSSLNAQVRIGKVTGVVTSMEGKAIDGATASLLKLKDSSLVKVGISNTSGVFEMERIATGKYFIKVSAIGFKSFVGTALEISETKSEVDVKNIKLTADGNVLQNVEVVTKRPLIENKIDKMVVNVEASATNVGLSALEVLEKSPGVTVDNDGNISVKGKSGVIVLMDGKPAYLSGRDLANYLKNLPSNQLDQIEIMTQPSAKYDASGNSGIINIKTKKNKADGFNGSISTSAIFANYFKNTNSINVNFRKNKVNLFANYGYSYWEGFNEIDISRQYRTAKGNNFFRSSDQNTYGRFYGYPHNFKAGIDYFATKKTTLGFVLTGLFDNRKFKSETTSNFYDSTARKDEYNISNTENHDVWTNLGFNVNFRQLIDNKGKELTADADYIFYRTKGKQYSNNYLYNINGDLKENPYLLNGNLPGNIDIFSFKSDYTHPLPKNAKLEAGIKASYVKTDNDAQYTTWSNSLNKWDIDTSRSNHFIYKENINAAYVNLQKQLGKWGLQLGLRAEQTISEGKQIVKNSTFKKDYTKVFPTLYVSYKYNDKSTFGLSYGRRIERPGYMDLNPFQYLLDRYTYQEGNPYLQPQFSHNVELSYNYKGQLNISTNYTKTTDIINDILKNVKTGDNFTTFQTKENIASRRNIGLAISYNRPIKKWWNLNAFANVYNNYYNGLVNNEPVSLGFTAFSGNLSNQFTFKKGWSAEVSGFYNSKNLVSSVIVARPMGMFSLGAGKQILKTKGTVRLNIRDPFWLMKFRGTTDMETFVTNIQSKWDNRRFIISFVYRFGKPMGQQPQRKRSSSAQDELNRVNVGGQQ
jgi:outer membrane receptor protein involved in Fe transport